MFLLFSDSIARKGSFRFLEPSWNARAISFLRMAVFLGLLASYQPATASLLCSIPGKDGPGNPSGVINTYYPGTSSVSAGTTSIPVGFPSGDLSKTIAIGDLLLVIQMQDADISYSNDSNYGGGSATGNGYTSLNQAGVYEYVTAAGSVAGGSVPITSGLANSYRVRAASGSNGQSTFQVIRVPQYSTATVSGTISALFWDGSVGGVVAMDVAGTLTVNGAITADGAGFRGGLARLLMGGSGAYTDYRTSYTNNANGSKGEGIAGTPQYLNGPTSYDGAPAAVTSLGSGYPDGTTSNASYGRGAPGNAGGGGTDGNPAANDQNSGGGGGGNYAVGATGGNSWSSNLTVGGVGGGAVTALAFNRVVMGGGGGAGTSNNGVGDTATYTSPPGLACSATDASCASGAPGGGIIILRSNTMAGGGSISANGGDGYNILQDGTGGGGAGGSIVLYTQSGGTAFVSANGGNGGNAWRSHTVSADRHGPGGGGSGGFVAYSPASGFSLAASVNPGTSGKSCNGDAYGSTSSSGGISVFQSPNVPGPKPGAACLPLLTVTKSTSTPTIAPLPGTATYTISVANASGTSTANNAVITDTLPGAPALFTNNSAAPTVTYVPNSAPCNASRMITANAATGSSTPSWSNWDIPAGCTVSLSFNAAVPGGTIATVYQNPATVTYDDPAKVGQRLSSSYNPLSSTAEDVQVLAPPTVAKSFGASSIVVGGTTTVTLTLTNPNSTPVTGVTFSDTLPTSAAGAPGNMTIVNPPLPTSTCGGTPTVTATNGSGIFTIGGSGYTIPAKSSCTVTFTVTAPAAGIYVNTIPAGNLSSSTGGNTNPATASLTAGTGLLPPTMTKSFLTNPILVGTTSTLRFTLTNPNASTAIGSAGFIDSLPPELVVASPSNATTTCTGGTVTAAAGTGYISLNTNGTIPAGGSCLVNVDVTSTTAGLYANTSGQVVGNTGTGNRATDTLVVMAPLVVAKSFATNPVAQNTATVLTIKLTNPNSVAVTGASFTDTYPSGLVNTASPSAATTCGGGPTITAANGGTSLSVGGSGATVPANSSCTLTVNVQSATSGSYTNSTGTVTSTNAGTSAAGIATLNVLAPPIVLESFTPSQIPNGGQSNLQLVIGNPSTNAAALTGIVLTDSYTGTLANAAAYTSIICTDGSSATISGGANGGTTVGITAGTIQPGGTCTINQLVTATSSNTNTTTAPTSANGGTGTAASAYLQVLQPLIVSKTFSRYEIARNTDDTMTISMYNPNPVAAVNVHFADTYPNANTMTNNPAQTTSPGGNCGAGASLVSVNTAPPSLTLANATIPANSTCTVTQVIRVATNNISYINSVTVNTDNLGSASDTAVVTTGSANARVYFTKGFTPAAINVGGTSTLRFDIYNPHTATATGIAFTDVLPAGMTATNTGATAACNGTYTVTGSDTITFTGGSLGAGSPTSPTTCNFSIGSITSSIPGIYVNQTGNITASTGQGGLAAASLSVNYPPIVTTSFGSSTIASGGSTTMTLSFSNLNAAAITTSAVFNDVFPVSPGAMTLANGTLVDNTCGFTPTDTSGGALGAGDTGVRVPNGSSIPVGGCYFTVNVTASAVGNYTNTTPVLQTSTGNAAAVSAGLTVVAQPPSVTKAFSPSTVSVAGTTTLLITLANSNAAPISLSALLTDTFPANIVTAATPNRSTTCYTSSGALAATGGTASKLTLASGAIIPAGTPETPGTCTVQVDVTPSASGVYTNTIPAGAVQTSVGNNASGASAVLTVPANTPPSVSKAFGATDILTGTTISLTLTLTNTNPTAATLNANLDDTLPTISGPGNLVIASPNGLTGTCPGSVTAIPGTNLIRYVTNATIPAGGCTIVVNVTSATAGTYINTIAAGALNTNLGVSPGATSGTLNVYALPVLTVTKTTSPVISSINPGQPVTYTSVITNSGAGSATIVELTDSLSPYTAWGVNSFGAGIAFQFVDGTGYGGAASGLTLGTPVYSNDKGVSWSYAPTSTGGGAPAGYDANVTNWKIPMTGTMNGWTGSPNPKPSFTINYKVLVR